MQPPEDHLPTGAGGVPVTDRRILITGSRWFDSAHESVMRNTILEEFNQFNDAASWGIDRLIFIAGGARGADDWARYIVKSTIASDVVLFEEYKAAWQTNGKAAGFIRNQKMVDLGADICYAFLVEGRKNAGTKDCMSRAKKAGIPVVEIWVEDHE